MSYSEPLGDAWKYDPEYNRVAEFLGVDRFKREDYDVAKKISTIRDYLDLNGKLSRIDQVLSSIQKIKKSLGSNTQGELLVNELYQHARLDVDRRRAEAIEPKVRVEPKAQKVEKKEKPIDIKEIVSQTVQGALQGLIKHQQPQMPQQVPQGAL